MAEIRNVILLAPNGKTEHQLCRNTIVAMGDLKRYGRIDPAFPYDAPITMTLRISEGRLHIALSGENDEELQTFILSMTPYRRIIRDYYMMIDSHEQAIIAGAHHSKLEAIDMGRRGLHNDGANLLRDRLSGKIGIDHDTARNFFSLLCCLGAETGLAGGRHERV